MLERFCSVCHVDCKFPSKLKAHEQTKMHQINLFAATCNTESENCVDSDIYENSEPDEVF